ncbi:MAG: SRPBCC family protein [Planctomycetes bacterium]|nr:SRPBCC family protein [Planctomycetota bacterium]
MFTCILLGLVAVIGVLLIVIATRPTDFRVTRSARMNATPAAVFAQVNDFHNWEAWSPWVKMDPNAKSTFEGPSSGTGSVFHWDGNKDVGAGSMTILQSDPNDRIHIKLAFVRPFAATNDVEFTFKPEGDQTAVTWSMAGKNNFTAKAIGLFMDCEKMVGEQFDKGLANMKAIVESTDKQ